MKTIALFLLGITSIHAVDYTYNTVGQLLSESYPNGAHVFYTYDELGNLTQRQTHSPNPSPSADLAITSTLSPTNPAAGQQITLTFTVTNNGPDPATNISLTETLPANLNPLSLTTTQGSTAINEQDLTLNLGTLPNGETATLTLTALLLDDTPLSFTFNFTSPEDSNPSNNASPFNLTPNQGVDLLTTNESGPNPSLTSVAFIPYAINITNQGPSSATNLLHTITLPPDLLFVFSEDPNSTHNNGTITTNLANLNVGETHRFFIGVASSANPGHAEMIASITSSQTELIPATNTTSLTTELLAPTLTVTNTNDSGAGSFRQALLDANLSSDRDVIGFTIPGFAIPSLNPVTDLPTVTEPVLIDAFSAEAGVFEINGTGLTNALSIESSDVCLRGLVLNQANNRGLFVQAPTGEVLTNLLIEGCIFGLNGDGDTDLGNGTDGAFLNRVTDSSIGGPLFWQPCLFSGNGDDGLEVESSCSNLTIQGNKIGTDITGNIALGNASDGLDFAGNLSRIGGEQDGEFNLISGNERNGLSLDGFGNQVLANRIGTNLSGDIILSNNTDSLTTRAGVDAEGTSSSSPNLLRGNLISGNRQTNLRLGENTLAHANTIGPALNGETALPDVAFREGVLLLEGASLGGVRPGEGNQISGHTVHGIRINALGDDDVFVSGNLIGTNSDGSAALANGGDGILIHKLLGETFIGLGIEGASNLISGNADNGIHLNERNTGDPNPENVTILGNLIGTNLSGDAAIPNQDDGIVINGNNIAVGGPNRDDGNLISGNADNGIRSSSGATNILIQGNIIGTDLPGTTALGNQDHGIDLDADGAQILDNLISGNGTFHEGLELSGDNHLVQGNIIGTDRTGTIALPNVSGGLRLFADNTTIGGAEPGQGNLISGNNNPNLEIIANTITILGNTIGPDITGTTIPTNAPANVIGVDLVGSGTLGQAGSGNLISGNTGNGIETSGGWTIQDNLIGTTADSLTPLPNQGNGVVVSGSNLIITGNTISANTADGLLLTRDDNFVQANLIGTNSLGHNLGNGGNGIRSQATFGGNTIGGLNPGEGNTIAHNTLDGVRNEGLFTFGGDLAILGNSIYSNGGLGIDNTDPDGLTNGVTPNDPLDSDQGNSDYQNFPLITTAGNTITGTLNSEPSKTYRIEFFANTAADPSGNGEGKTFLGHLDTTTDANGDNSFTFTPTTNLIANTFITATATNPNNQTSEFGPALIVTGASGFTDSDGDGMSDDYELEHFGSSTGGDPNADSDGDGQSNLAEFIALTDPNDPTSFLTISIHLENGNAIISVKSEPGRFYQLTSSNDLTNFHSLGNPQTGDGSTLQFLDPLGTRQFYQITVTP
ncbi:MAG: hypothetical protein AAGC74_02785 [Verrucomicrobiota bacterium]